MNQTETATPEHVVPSASEAGFDRLAQRERGRHRAPTSQARLALLGAALVAGSAGTAIASAVGWL